jgi:hypothetical protein
LGSRRRRFGGRWVLRRLRRGRWNGWRRLSGFLHGAGDDRVYLLGGKAGLARLTAMVGIGQVLQFRIEIMGA